MPIDADTTAILPPLLAALPVNVRQASRTIVLAPEQLLFARGDRVRVMHYVTAGEVRLVRRSRDGVTSILQRARQGLVAEASFGQQTYHCDAQAATAATVLAIPCRSFATALDDATFRAHWHAHLSRELRRVRAQCERLSLRTARERVVHFIDVEGERGMVRLSIAKKDWAAELGISHEALYRTLAAMQRSGELSVEGATLRLSHGRFA